MSRTKYQNEVRRRAWALMRSVYKYGSIPYSSIGPACLRWCIDRAAQDLKYGTPAERFERQAAALAEKHGYDTAALRFHHSRYSFGSLSLTLDADKQRNLYWRALAIAHERAGTEVLQAAE